MRFLICLIIILFSFAALASSSFAQSKTPPKPEYLKGKVIKITKEGTKDVGGVKNLFQNLTIRLLDGADKGKEIAVEHGGMFTLNVSQKLREGDTVILSTVPTKDKKVSYRVIDRYRLTSIIFLIFGFFAVVVAVAGRKGAGAVVGMVISLAVIIFFIVPQILSGSDPLFISIVGSIVILVTTIYLAHGFNQQTTIALIATCVSLFLTALLSILFVNVAKLSGLGTEDAYSLQQMFHNTINFQGLLLGGIIIGSLGVLDDVTTTQAATIAEFAKADEKSTVRTLVKKGMKIGRTHIASVVNTLILAYAGASIGIFIFLVLGVQNNVQPLWVILNSEIITEEIVRSLAGSVGLILAVPITTILAAFFAKHEIVIK